MIEPTPPPDHSTLLPPLIACLPAAFASHRPPPAVLPLLSPILRQRVQLLSTSTAASTDSWLHLLCWNPSKSARLAEIVQSDKFELHPSSGEIELGEIGTAQYRRLDEETLHARLDVEILQLSIIYVWCEGDEEGGGCGWRVSELEPLESKSESPRHPWFGSVTEANDNSIMATISRATNWASENQHIPQEVLVQGVDDDEYWAQYDNTPARTPALHRTPVPCASLTNAPPTNDSEAAYFAQYSHIQPEMDGDDPSEDPDAFGQSSLNGNAITGSIIAQRKHISEAVSAQISINGFTSFAHQPLIHTRPSSSSSSSIPVPRLEGSAAVQSHAEVAVQQHISTSLKSLFRLARGTGIDKEEFERLVQTELSTMSMMADGD